jgi:hypothetical protein
MSVRWSGREKLRVDRGYEASLETEGCCNHWRYGCRPESEGRRKTVEHGVDDLAAEARPQRSARVMVSLSWGQWTKEMPCHGVENASPEDPNRTSDS